jgi:hypothetical protein
MSFRQEEFKLLLGLATRQKTMIEACYRNATLTGDQNNLSRIYTQELSEINAVITKLKTEIKNTSYARVKNGS